MKKKWIIGLVLITIFVVAGLANYKDISVDAADTRLSISDLYFYTNQNIYNKGEYSVTTSTTRLYLMTEEGLPDTATIEWESSNENIIEIRNSTTLNHSCVLVRKAPGYSTITATVTYGGSIYSIYMVAKVDLEVKDGPFQTGDTKYTDLTQILTTGETAVVLQYDPDGQYASGETDSKQIYLQYVSSDTDIDGDLVRWTSKDEGIAKVSSDGKVTAVSAGMTTIVISTATSSGESKAITRTVDVIVEPKVDFSNYEDPDTSDNTSWYDTGTITVYANNFYITSSATPANNLSWEVIDVNGNVVDADSSVLNYSVSKTGNSVAFTNAKVGTYTLYGYVNSDYSASTHVGCIKLTINVSLVAPTELLMNVGDTYDLVDNLNLPNVEVITTASSSDRAVVSVANGSLSANSIGTAVITLTYKTYNSVTGSYEAKTVSISVEVIDTISISLSSAVIYTAGTIQLEAVVTNSAYPITWASSDTSIATVTNSGLVKGVKVGKCTITATQTIGGITKTAICQITVQQSITNIVLDPSEVAINVGEYKTINAILTPSNLSGVKLTWISSDKNIVDITETGSKYCSIKGVSGGTATLMAVNQDNVIVGFCKVTVKTAVTGIVLSETSVVVSLTNKSFKLTATVTPSNATVQTITWSSTDNSVVRVAANGTVTLVAAGTASVIATSSDNPAITAMCKVTVTTPVTGISLDDSSKRMLVGESTKLTYTVIPTTAYNTDVTWSSSDKKVATVNSAGKVTAVAPGSVVITVKTVDGAYSATCTITVMQGATSIALDKTKLTLNVGGTYTLIATPTPATSTDTFTWETSNDEVATVSSIGKVTGKKAGTAIIIAKSSSGITAICNVTVEQQATGIELNYTTKTVVVTNKFKLKATVLPKNATNQKVTFKSSNKKVATVSSSGNVTGVKGGTAVITVTSDDGSYVANCIVTVKELITSVNIPSSYKLGKGKTYTFKPTIKTNSATTTTLKWTSSNTKVLKVDKDGTITGVGYGTATITVKATDGSGAKDTCTVRVVRQVTSVSLSKTAVTIVEGKSLKIKTSIKPTNATYKTAKWTSSDETVAVVDQKGNITAIKAGTCTITATAKDSSKKSAKCIVTVIKQVSASSITVADQELVLVTGESKTVQTVMSPVNTTDGYKWSSDNNSVATVNKSTGKIVAKSVGTANITVMTDSGKTARIKVIVVGLSKSSLTLEQYTSHTLWVNGATNVSWDVENPAVATVSNGRVTARAVGKTNIIATVNGRRLTCKLTVTKIN